MTYEVLSSLPPEVDGSRTRLGRQDYKLVALRTMDNGGVTFTGPSHPGVLPLIELITLEGRRMAVYGYVAGVTLRELVEVFRAQSKMVPLDLLSRVIIDAAKALGAVTAGHWHNGVSDAAIAVGFDGITRVLDYGAPRSAGRFGTRSPLPGAPRDVFTLGAVVHSALTDFTGHYLGAAESLQLPSKVHPEATPALDDVVMTSITGALEQRQISVAQLATELEAVLGGLALDANGVSALLKRLFRDRVSALIRATSTPRTSLSTPAPQPPPNPFGSVLDAEPATEMARAPPGMADEPPTYVGATLQRKEPVVAPSASLPLAPNSVFVDESTAVDRPLPPKPWGPRSDFHGSEAQTSLVIERAHPSTRPPERIDLSTHPAVYSKDVLRSAGLVEKEPVPVPSVEPVLSRSVDPTDRITEDLDASLSAFARDAGEAPKRIDLGTNPGIKPKDLSRSVDPGGAPGPAETGLRAKDLPIIDEARARSVIVDEETKPLSPLGGPLEAQLDEGSDASMKSLPGVTENTNPGIELRDFAKTLDELSPSVLFGDLEEPPKSPPRPTVPVPPNRSETRDASFERTQEQVIARPPPTSDWELAQRATEAESDDGDEAPGSRMPLLLLMVAMTAAIIAVAFALRHLFASEPVRVPLPRHLMPMVSIDAGHSPAALESHETDEDDEDDDGGVIESAPGEPRKVLKRKKKRAH